MCHIVGYNIAGIYHMKLSNYNKTGILGYITGCGSPGQQNFNLSFTPCSSGLVLLGSLGTHFHFPVTSLSYLQLVSSQEIQWGSLVEVNQAILARSLRIGIIFLDPDPTKTIENSSYNLNHGGNFDCKN